MLVGKKPMMSSDRKYMKSCMWTVVHSSSQLKIVHWHMLPYEM